MKNEFKEYLETGILGGYHPEQAILREDEDGDVHTTFRDTTCRWENDGYTKERRLVIGGKCFLVSSVFQRNPTATPTEKMLSLIDSEAK